MQSVTWVRAGSEPARLSRGRETRERIREAAIGLVAERGHHAASAACIASRAGVTKSTLFHHYASKRDLLRDAIEHASRRVRDALQACGTEADRASLGAAIASLVDLFGQPGLATIVSRLLLAPPAEVAAFGVDEPDHPLQQALAMLTAAIDGSARCGSIRRLSDPARDHGSLARLVLAVVAMDAADDRRRGAAVLAALLEPRAPRSAGFSPSG